MEYVDNITVEETDETEAHFFQYYGYKGEDYGSVYVTSKKTGLLMMHMCTIYMDAEAFHKWVHAEPEEFNKNILTLSMPKGKTK